MGQACALFTLLNFRSFIACELNCQNGGTQTEDCTVCICPAGFVGDECQSDVNECVAFPQPCLNGICINTFGSFRCDCNAGFTGELCEAEIDACEFDPCRNGGSCTSELGQFTCTCAVDFTGTTCDLRIDDCVSDPCLNGATCEDGIGDFTCLCPDNFEGRLCDMCNIENCISCSQTISGECLQCRPGYLLAQNSTCGMFPTLCYTCAINLVDKAH